MPRILITFLSLLTILSVSAHAQTEVPASREQITLSYSPVAKKVMPAVVNIYTKQVQKVQVSPLFSDPLFSQFFGGGFGGAPRERVVNSLGTGVIVGEEGTIVTSYHVVNGSDEITIVLPDKREFEAKVEKTDERSDLAVLKVDTRGAKLPVVELGESAGLEVGDLVLAIGNPFGVGQTVTSGIVSATARSAESVSDYQFFIQTDAAINPGNSGGALVDMKGKLIGINTAIYTRSGGYQGIGFAIPADMVRAVLKGTAGENGQLVRPWFGIAIQPVTKEIADAQGLPSRRGVLVQEVAKGSPAETAGIRAGDILLTLAGSEVDDSQNLNFRIATSGMGVAVPAVVWREGREVPLTVTFTTRPAEAADAKAVQLKGDHPLGGVVVVQITPDIAQELKLKADTRAVVVVRTGRESRVDVAPGDIIVGVNGVKIATVSDLEKALAKRARGFQIQIIRGGMSLSMTIM